MNSNPPISTNMGPKLIKYQQSFLQLGIIGDQYQPNDNQISLTCVKITYISNDTPRFDGSGRNIMKGLDYGIEFVDIITVCVFDQYEEVTQVQKSLDEYKNNEFQKKLQKYPVVGNDNHTTFYSSLKKAKK